MKKIIIIAAAVIIASSAFGHYEERVWCYTKESLTYRDGIDRRISLIKRFLSKNLPYKEYKKLSFKDAVVHTKDSQAYYIKIPFIDKQKEGFLLVKKSGTEIKYVQLLMEGYKYNVNYMPPKKIAVNIVSKKKELSKRLYVNATGAVERVTDHRLGSSRDTIYGVVKFILSASVNGHLQTYINANLIFDPIDSLNHDALTKGTIPHDLIPLGRVPEPIIENEFGNWVILKPVSIDSMFKKFDAKDTLHR